ncbi:hypothetical protein LSUE1_G008843 [Lachnellula suecica]|uniref:ubiquitinyl hydrolase 1 n=1 Tax=Lachnellula suecica TaxID=602035 RepID=A0A8T9C6H6_9HELO|nr:hypothetical protein LSUE1_G008843 [Lachnellula suecica]
MSDEALMYLVHHMFLPPKLPQKDDTNVTHQKMLFSTLTAALSQFIKLLPDDMKAVIERVLTMVHNSLAVHEFGSETILLQIHAQNAGLMISKMNDDSVQFETFELSPLNQPVMTTKGRLRRSFPGIALSLSAKVFERTSLQDMLAQTLAKMSHQPATGMQPTAAKGGRMHDESRAIITELFMGLLRSVGEPVEVSHLTKNTREEIVWKNSLLPWRRSPTWLLLRVSMQLAFQRSSIKVPGDLYKIFMAFLLGKTLEISQQNLGFPSDLMHVMNSKLVRRLLKLGPYADSPGLNFVRDIMRRSTEMLHKRRELLMDQAEPTNDFSRLQFSQDILNSLPPLDDFIKSIACRKKNPNAVNFQPNSCLVVLQTYKLPPPLSRNATIHDLKELEAWVCSYLDSWLEPRKKHDNTCQRLSEMIQNYHGVALILYTGSVEELSVMLLTIVELWIACDVSATAICELLKNYDPDIPIELLGYLALPLKSQMERLQRAETYLNLRRAHSRHSSSLVFQSFGHQDSFSVQFSTKSKDHENILQQINRSATEARNEKLVEFRKLKERYTTLLKRHEDGECEYTKVVTDSFNGFYTMQHTPGCKKCAFKIQAGALNIQTHEWPLSNNILEAQATVFELAIPPWFSHWRDITMRFRLDVLKSVYTSENSPRASYPLQSYEALSSFVEPSPTRRFDLLSQDKPHEVTHRRVIYISTSSERDVCLDSGLHYQYYDNVVDCFVNDLRITEETMILCTYKLPASSTSLQQFIFQPIAKSHTATLSYRRYPNTAISSQSECPTNMSLEEFKALSTICLGNQIKLQNILLQLCMPAVDFKKVETGLVILQSIYQAGPPSDDFLRQSHRVLTNRNFAGRLLEAIQVAFQSVKQNWESSQALSIFISLITRLLSLALDENIKSDCLDHLDIFRTVAYGWLSVLNEKAHKATDDYQKKDFRSKAVEIALLCVDSFNIEDSHLADLFSKSNSASVFIQCLIVIQEGETLVSGSSNSMLSILHRRWKGLCYRSYPFLAKQILENKSTCLDDAIKKSWCAHQTSQGWLKVSENMNYWLLTAPQIGTDALTVHFNLLTGEFLVNGVPLKSLPSRYEGHQTYLTLFGNSALEVMPTAIAGMEFSGKKEHYGHTLHFGMVTRSTPLQQPDLLIQATKLNLIYHLLPRRIMRKFFPTAFVDGFVHWYDTSNNSVEFRPEEDPWTSSLQHWRLTKETNGSKWCLTRKGACLVGVSSDTANAVSHILSPLEDSVRIHVMYHELHSRLEIELPRLQLGFYLESGSSSIFSKQHTGMCIDVDQSCGTLFGLQSKLVLKHEKSKTEPRLLLLPNGAVTHETKGDHVNVTIGKDSSTKVHAYSMNETLGRLDHNGTLQSILFLCYLHALTSFCLPDPLTRQTGTEKALSILDSATIKSFGPDGRFTEENIRLLLLIAQLTPQRRYYPANEQVMQTVTWSAGLGFLAQHNGFYNRVKSLFRLSDSSKMLYQAPETLVFRLKSFSSELLARDVIRVSTFCVSGSGAENFTSDQDCVYVARDRDQDSIRGNRAFSMSKTIYERPTTLQYEVPSSFLNNMWTFLSQTNERFGGNHAMPPFSKLTYDSGLLIGSESSKFIASYWLVLHGMLRQNTGPIGRFCLMIWLSTLAFAKGADMDALQTLAAFFSAPVLPLIDGIAPPLLLTSSFRPREGAKLKEQEIDRIVRATLLPFPQCPEANLPAIPGESEESLHKRQQKLFKQKQGAAIKRFSKALENQWPCRVPTAPNDFQTVSLYTYINVEKAILDLKPKFESWYQNRGFVQYLSRIKNALSGQEVVQLTIPASSPVVPSWNSKTKQVFISTDDIFTSSAPVLSYYKAKDLALLLSPVTKDTFHKATPLLTLLIDNLKSQSKSSYEDEYVDDLRKSQKALLRYGEKDFLQLKPSYVDDLSNNLTLCSNRVNDIYKAICSHLNCPEQVRHPHPSDSSNTWAVAAVVKHYPRISPTLLLQQLTNNRWPKITNSWKRCIVKYAVSITEFQRAERLIGLSGAALIKELQNGRHKDWDSYKNREHLIFEIESGIMIRPIQEQIAESMKTPQSGWNAMMQFNMGEGKSSVIVPIVASALADGSQFVRVIVAKPQSKQMFEMLVSKVGGLLNRRIYHMPFTRSLKLTAVEAEAIHIMFMECMTTGGILLVQPEHLLSFKLMVLESFTLGKGAIGTSLLRTQRFFEDSSRDIVDESDENFSVKFELIYTMGQQQSIEFSPDRWSCIQQVLNLIKMFIPIVKQELPESMDVNHHWPGCFPRTRIFQHNAEHNILRRVAERICKTGIGGFSVANQSLEARSAILKYITEPDLTQNEIDQVEKGEAGGVWENRSSHLLLLRGLLAGGVLAFAFRQKRWRVNYGRDETRSPSTKLAVPYRAKDSPSLRSEFSHPDVVIVLTCLSYYYGGLNNEDLFVALGHLMKSDQRSDEYQAWVADAPELPSAFRHLVGINLKDETQCKEEVFPHLRYAKAAVDYFLAHIVFPKEMKEFPHKLSGSGWDIGERKSHRTTGFSGTNDSQKVLPLGVEHVDLPNQKHTNALVLNNLLQPINSCAQMPPRGIGSASDAVILLEMVVAMKPEVRVILDVGAQILELSNLEVAKEWLKMVPDDERTQAAIFFNDNDEICVLTRNGNIELLQTSAFAKKLDQCLVFLDEAHTRGTDLKLPATYRAAVTLGPNLTKDRLMQASMRMRLLDRGQSIVFLISEEIKNVILSRKPKPSYAGNISVLEVLSWAVSETWSDTLRMMPLWAEQGRGFERRRAIWAESRNKTALSQAQAIKFSRLQEEQERELAPEIEQESQFQRPAEAKAVEHKVHDDLRTLIATGFRDKKSKAFIPAFESLKNTSAAQELDISQFPNDLQVTADFVSTVLATGKLDAYQRAVQWVLTIVNTLIPYSKNTVEQMVLLSPFEVNELLADVQKSKKAMLHMYSPRQNSGFPALDGLNLYNVPESSKVRVIPRRFIVQLNLFAGQLYFGSFKEYVEVCEFLGLAWEVAKPGCVVAADNFIIKSNRGSGVAKSTFKSSPVKFLKVLMTRIRRNCEGVDKTHMGKLLDGIILTPADFGEKEEF